MILYREGPASPAEIWIPWAFFIWGIFNINGVENQELSYPGISATWDEDWGWKQQEKEADELL